MSSESTESRPKWWEENIELRRQLDLPEYDPPRFSDEVYTYNIVSRLEEEYDCSIRFFSKIDPHYPDDWRIEINGNLVASIGRHRTKQGNTRYEISSVDFIDLIEEHVNN